MRAELSDFQMPSGSAHSSLNLWLRNYVSDRHEITSGRQRLTRLFSQNREVPPHESLPTSRFDEARVRPHSVL